MYNLAVDQWRRRKRRPEVFVDVEPPGRVDPTDVVALRQALVAALAQLPPRQRAVLVLRYWEQLTEAETAGMLGCSVGNVKSTASRGVTTELLINGTRYWGTEPRPDGRKPPGTHEEYSLYGQYKGRYEGLTYGASEDPVLGTVAPDPAGLLKALREAKATVTGKPDGTLGFTYSTTRDKDSQTFTGDVSLDANGRIAKMVVVALWETTIKNRLDRGEATMTTEFSDWGLPVTVERPARVIPAD
jgi:hypothetical protein